MVSTRLRRLLPVLVTGLATSTMGGETVTSGQTAAEAAARMTVPAGFRVRVIAAEPDVHQPVAFTIDDRGRLWVVEGFTYPQRRKEGEGKDTILIFEDTTGDGDFDRRTVFAEGLNLVSGIAVGFGGVWVGAAPYLLFLADRDGDDRPDGPPEVLLDGWGYQDTHETLNSFTWGPDGWLYGCQGVFTHSRVGKPGTPDEERVPLNAAVWRYHPTRHEFEVFAWGTSNPWGIDFNDDGQMVITACVIPHLYHVIQGARYERQSGQHFNAHVYDDIKTIADHLHHAGKRWTPEHAEVSNDFGGGHAHCGAMVYLGDNFPASYRGKVFMSNLHGRRINVDSLERSGSGFVGRHEKDFLFANDRWFMGIDMKYGPDGTVYFTDWYDKQTCHDRKPEAWDRTNGRIYNVAHGEPRRVRADLRQLPSGDLVELLLHRNDWFARNARRLLQERGDDASIRPALSRILAGHPDPTRKLRALWTLHATGGLTDAVALEQLESPHEYVRAWTIQLVAESRRVAPALLAAFERMGREDPSPVVRLYLASALQRLPRDARWSLARGLTSHAADGDDHNLPLVLWYGVEALAATQPARAMELAAGARLDVVKRFITRRVASNVDDLEPLMAVLIDSASAEDALPVLDEMARAFEGRVDLKMPAGWKTAYEKLAASARPEVLERVQALAVKFGDRRIFPLMRRTLADPKAPLEKRRHAMAVLLDGKDPDAVAVLSGLLAEPALRGPALRGLAAYTDPGTPAAILQRYASWSSADRLDAVNTLASRPPFARALLAAIRDGKVPRTDLSAFTVRQLKSFQDAELDRMIEEVWGAVRRSTGERLARIEKHKALLTDEYLAGADRPAGRVIFEKTCAQCHTLFGAGGKIAPDLTGSNRKDMDYILQNMFDPNAVVGKDYQLNIFVLNDGRVVSGLVARETESALTVQTVNEEVVIPRRSIVRKDIASDSMMPEGLVDKLAPDELRDLVAYLRSPAQVPMRGAPARVDPLTHRVAGALEGEKLKVLRKPRGNVGPQDMSGYGRGEWSGNHQLWWTSGKPGDRLVLSFPVEVAGTYGLDVALTKARDYGVVRFFVDGKSADAPIDLFNPEVIPTGTLRLGAFDLGAGEHRLGVEIVGANPQAVQAFMFGLDYVLLDEVK